MVLNDPQFIAPLSTALCLLMFSPSARAADLVVTNATDTVNGTTSSPAALVAAPGADGISLREAITACNNAAGPHTITFASSLTGQTIALTTNLRITRDGVAILGALGADGRPAIMVDASNPAVGAALDVTASDFSLQQIRLIGIRQVYGLKIHAPAAGPLVLANLRVEQNEFAAGGANINNNAISVGPDDGAVGAKISNVTIVRNLFQHFTGDGDGVLAAANGAGGCVLENLRIEENRFEDTAFPIELTFGGNGVHAQNRIQGARVVRNIFVGNSLAVILAGGTATGSGSTTDNVIADTLITDNLMADNGTAIYVNGGGAGATGNQITGTQILRNSITSQLATSSGISVGHGTGDLVGTAKSNVIADTLIADNTVSGSVAFGVAMNGGGDNTNSTQIRNTQIARNRFTSAGTAVYVFFFNSNGASPATSDTITDTTVTQNLLLGTSSGIVLNTGGGSVAGNQILKTQITNNVIAGIRSGGAIGILNNVATGRDNRIDGVQIANNTIVDFVPAGFPAVGGGVGGPGNTLSGVKISNTIFWHNAGGDAGGVVQPSDVSNCLTADSR